MRVSYLCFPLLVFLVFGCNSDQKPNAAADLIQAFGDSCTTNGSWTAQALSHSQAIATTIQDLANNDPCKPFEASLGVIQSAATSIQGIVQDPTYAAYRTSEEDVQNLTLGLQEAPSGSDLAAALSGALVSDQVTLAENQAANQVDQTIQGENRYATATANLATLAQQMLQQSGNLAACLQSSPSVAVELASNMLAIGGSFVSPIFGAAGSAIGQLINFAVEYARQSESADALWNLEQVQMPTALGCGLETMSELYCDASDSLNLLSLEPQSGGSQPIPDIWKGTDLLLHRMPILDNWLLTIRNGVQPGDPQEAQRQDVIWAKIAFLDQANRDITGLINQQTQLYNASAGNPTNQQNILVNAILGADGLMMPQNQSPPPPDPFTDITQDPDVLSCWLVLGPNMLPPNPQVSPTPGNMCPQHIPNQNDYGATYIRNHLLDVATMQGVMTNWQGLYQVVQTDVDIEFSQTITANPDSIMAAAKEAPIDNVSPYEALQMLADFLQVQIDTDDGSNPNKLPFVESILQLVNQALTTIDDQSDPTIARVTQIFNQFQLEQGTEYLDTSVSQIVGWDLADRVRKKEFPTDINDVLYASGEDIASRIGAAGIASLDSIQLDMNNARSITVGNLNIFREFFQSTFGKAVQYLHDQAVASGEPAEGPDRPFGQTLGHLCTLLVATGMQWPDGVSWDICSQAVLNSIFPDPDGNITIHVGDLATQLSGQPFETRVCAFHRFLLAGRYAEIYSPPAPPRPAISTAPLDFMRFLSGRR